MKKIKYQILYLREDEKKAHNDKPSYWTPEEPHGNLEYMITSPDYIVREFTGKLDIDGIEIYAEDIIITCPKYRKKNNVCGYSRNKKSKKTVKYKINKMYTGYGLRKDTKYKIIGNTYKYKIN